MQTAGRKWLPASCMQAMESQHVMSDIRSQTLSLEQRQRTEFLFSLQHPYRELFMMGSRVINACRVVRFMSFSRIRTRRKSWPKRRGNVSIAELVLSELCEWLCSLRGVEKADKLCGFDNDVFEVDWEVVVIGGKRWVKYGQVSLLFCGFVRLREFIQR